MNKLADDPLWFKDAIIYQTHVKTFADSNGDGIGDFQGLIERLDYLERLGITALWILPFYPSPLRDDGYDIADYYSVNPSFGTLDDFRQFLKEAHARGIWVITELVMNHTSDQNAWFQKSRRSAPGSAWRDFYVWNDSPDKYRDARIIFKDFEHSNWTYDPVAKAYFWHRFYSHQPDLNFENPEVHKELLKVMDFWLAMGVDGVRLDAVPYLYEEEGTTCENLPKTHEFIAKLRAHIDAKFKNKMLLAEANQWPEDAVEYFGKNGEECHMSFHFPLMPRMFMGIQMEDRFPILDILDQTPPIPETCQWATFLRNHDELTLEMVTDEERDYMWRVYATDTRARINLGIRRRLAPLLHNSRRKVELINILLLSLPGTPIIYYGDEIGMGDNFYLGDRDGVRTPMQWSADRNAGFSRANPQKLYLPITIDPEYHYEAVNVENQEQNLSSLLWWTRRVIAVRKQIKAFGRGTIEFLMADNSKVLAFVREFEDERILVLANLSRFTQFFELDLSKYAGLTPTEIFSNNKLPAIKETPTPFMLGRHEYYWFALRSERGALEIRGAGYEPVEISGKFDWSTLLEESGREFLEEEVLPKYLPGCRWFGGKARKVTQIKIDEIMPVANASNAARLLFLLVGYSDGPAEMYLLPLQIISGDNVSDVIRDFPQYVIARAGDSQTNSILCDAVVDPEFHAALLNLLNLQKPLKGRTGEVVGTRGYALEEATGGEEVSFPSRLLKVEQSNSSIIYDNRFFLKLYRKLEYGVNPDAEITRYLSENRHFEYVPPFAGSLELRRRQAEPRVLGLMQAMVQNEGDAWQYTLDSVSRYFDRVLRYLPDPSEVSPVSLFGEDEPGELLADLVGGVYPERARQLGERTADMHIALAGEMEDPAFTEEPFSTLYQRSVYQSMRGSLRRMLQLLKSQVKNLPDSDRELAEELLKSEKPILDRLARVTKSKIKACKTRIHGDYHLGQVLNTGKDFMIIDFEGEPSRSLSERKLKRSPLRDVAGMLRSFHYAAHSGLLQQMNLREEDHPAMLPWADLWASVVCRTYFQAYQKKAAGHSFVPDDPSHLEVLVQAFVLDKAVYEVGYELNMRPTWVSVPIRGILGILGTD